jgi:hypothetical protein
VEKIGDELHGNQNDNNHFQDAISALIDLGREQL